jgi:two-component system sensor histidine kinase BaeS
VGIIVFYVARRITRPLETLTAAADEVAAGHYHVALPERTGGSELERLSARFGEMAAKLEESDQLSRNFLMSVSHELRTPLTAIRGHVAALREGVVDDEESRRRSLEVISEEALRSASAPTRRSRRRRGRATSTTTSCWARARYS